MEMSEGIYDAPRPTDLYLGELGEQSCLSLDAALGERFPLVLAQERFEVVLQGDSYDQRRLSSTPTLWIPQKPGK